MSKLFCDSCKKEIEEVILCSSGHLTCRECGSRCGCCDDVFCQSCFKRDCDKCHRKICGNCSIRCSSCGRFMCKTHGISDDSGNFICSDCSVNCASCGNRVNPKSIREQNGKRICLNCAREEFKKTTLRRVFD